MILLFLVSIILCVYYVAISARSTSEYDAGEYDCVLCMNVIDRIRKESISYSEACIRYNWCQMESIESLVVSFPNTTDSRKLCQTVNSCPDDFIAPQSKGSGFDIRVSKAYGSKGYDKVRISVISNETVSSSIFSYSKPFKYRWKDKILNTGIVSVTPGQVNNFVINGETISLRIPDAGEGVRGIIIADPCFQSQWVNCLYKDTFQTFARMTSILNAVHQFSDTDFWMILGDNFYDQTGVPTSSWFDALSQGTKTRLMASFPGNHDYW